MIKNSSLIVTTFLCITSTTLSMQEQPNPAHQSIATVATRMAVGISVGGAVGGMCAVREFKKQVRRDETNCLGHVILFPTYAIPMILFGATTGGTLGLACSPYHAKIVAQEAIHMTPILAQEAIDTAATTAHTAVELTTQLLQAFFRNLKG